MFEPDTESLDVCMCMYRQSQCLSWADQILDGWKERQSKKRELREKKMYVYDKQNWHQDPN